MTRYETYVPADVAALILDAAWPHPVQTRDVDVDGRTLTHITLDESPYTVLHGRHRSYVDAERLLWTRDGEHVATFREVRE